MSAIAHLQPTSVSKLATQNPISTTILIHNDHSNRIKTDDSDSSDGDDSDKSICVARGGVVTPFPWKVHDMLEKGHIDGIEDIVSWLPHGRAFVVHNVDEFVGQVMPIWFSQTKFASFQRQLNLYGFRRLASGPDKGAYFHEHFLRGERPRIQLMSRQKIKGTKVRRSIIPGMEPDFWKMPRLPVSASPPASTKPNNSSIAMRVTNNRNIITKNISSKPNESRILIKLPQIDDKESHSIPNCGPSTPTLSAEQSPDDGEQHILFFEGKPFHYLDRSIIAEHYSLPTE